MTVKSPNGRSQEGGIADAGRGGLPAFDVKVANPARVWDYWLGGKDNFAADRKAAEQVLEVLPWLPEAARRCRRFLTLSAHKLAADYGVRQFLDIGTGLPTAGNTHEVAQHAAPSSRIVYVDFDPVVASHARALLTSHPDGKTNFVLADLRDTEAILSEAAAILDFSHPVGLVLTSVLHFIPEADQPYRIVGKLMDAVPSGSFIVILHGASDIRADTVTEATRRYNELSSAPLAFRSREQVTRFFDGLDILDTGEGPGRICAAGRGQPSYYGIGRKPSRYSGTTATRSRSGFAGLRRLGGLLGGNQRGPRATPERGELGGRGGQADAGGKPGALPGGQLVVNAEQAVDAQATRADRRQGDRRHAQVQHVLVALGGDKESVLQVNRTRRDRHRADHRRRGQRRPGAGDQRSAGADFHDGARRRLQPRLLETDRAEPARGSVKAPPVADPVGDQRAADRRAQYQAGHISTAH